MLSALEAFKCGFLERCVEARLTPEQMLACAKQANDFLEKQGSVTGFLGGLLGKTVDVGRGIGGAALHLGVPAALALPPIAGGIAGYGLARATDISDTDVAELKDREVMEEYARQTERLRRQKAVRDYQQERRRTGRALI